MSIVAAGGIILGSGCFSGQIVVVRRRRYRSETGLPKGKSKGAESPMETALREVREETGFRVGVREFAGSTHYVVKGTPKTVFYFVMGLECEDAEAIEDTAEIDSIDWATPAAAIRRLSHREDQTLVAAVFGCNPWT
jgi:8-oxo-dGTP pyrophosphatase MutT (NUDIX family)